jgi:hypothetical protein
MRERAEFVDLGLVDVHGPILETKNPAEAGFF